MEPLMPFSSSKRSFKRSGGISLRKARSSSLIVLRRVLIQAIGIVGLAEEARCPALADDARFLQRPRQFDERQHGILGRLELGTWLPAVGKSAALGGSSWPEGETLSGG